MLTKFYLKLVPADHLASLVSSVTEFLYINGVSGCDLVTILDSVKSQHLSLKLQSLSREDTQALVRAMETCVEGVDLVEKVTLDIRILTEYSGQGKCKEVTCNDGTADRYRDQLRTWAMSRNWEVTVDEKDCFLIQSH